MTLKVAQATFDKAQEVALQNSDDFGELMAIGMAQLAAALQSDIRKLTSKLDDVERRVKRID